MLDHEIAEKRARELLFLFTYFLCKKLLITKAWHLDSNIFSIAFKSVRELLESYTWTTQNRWTSVQMPLNVSCFFARLKKGKLRDPNEGHQCVRDGCSVQRIEQRLSQWGREWYFSALWYIL